jgi:hypothetical protein
MYTNDRRALVIAILMGALALLLLSACDTPDSHAQARAGTPTTIGTAGTGAMATPAATDDITTDPATTATSDAGATATPLPDGDTVPTATADMIPTTVPTTTLPTATPVPTTTEETDPFTGTDDLTDTGDLTSTTTLSSTHPVALAIADFFGVPVDEVMAQHLEGQGFGEIARAYFLAQELAADGDPSNDLTAAQILALHQGGQGWGQIVRSLGLPQGNSQRNLGLIMSGHKHKGNQHDVGSTESAAPQSQDTPDKVKGGNGNNAGNGDSKDKAKNNNGGHGGKGNGDKGGGKGKKTK